MAVQITTKTYTLNAASDEIDGTGNGLANTITGNTAANILDGGTGADTLIGLGGNDTYKVDNVGDKVTEASGEGTDLVISSVSYVLSDNVEDLSLSGSSKINGTGNTGVNTITGNAGNNILNGKGGSDTLIGGGGSDTYIIDNTGVNITDAGTGLVKSSINYTLGSDLENLSLTGTALIGEGNTSANTITGNASANVLDGKGGNDKLIGGAGDDTYNVDSALDTITEVAGKGADLVNATVSYSLAANVENLSLTGTAADGTGNTLVNTITGNSLANIIDGKGGKDTLIGGDGDDTYVVSSTGVTVTEGSLKGTDLVQASVSYSLAANVENLLLTGNKVISGTGNTDNNTITGNSLANIIDGKGGTDVLKGGAGNDTYIVEQTGVTITENASEGSDLVKASISYTLAAEVENMSLTGASAINGTGNTGVNTITGNSLANTLDGQGGTDKLVGGKGNDTYIIDNTGVTVTEAARAGTDLVQSSISYTLSANVENLSLGTTSGIIGTGNVLANTITGNSLANILDGKGGADTLIGGDGDDTYTIGNKGVTVTEAADKGTDLVKASISYTLATNVENLSLTGRAVINGYGNSLANTITGNSVANILDGGVGADTLIGGKGNDTYIIDNASDLITEDAGTGTGKDLVKSSISYTLVSNVENMSLTGTSAINGTGNTDVNTITGNSLANILDGQGGRDKLVGGKGNDTYIIDNTGVTVTEVAGVGTGTDLVQSSISYTLSANVENLSLSATAGIIGTGNVLVNTITGNSLANILNGKGGKDTLIGGDGDDTYVIGNTGITVTEASGKGTDLVQSSISYTLAADVENLSLTGARVIHGTGNSLANTITGNAAANILDGGVGADTLIGGKGNDTYIIDNASDLVTEAAGTGTDLVKSSVTYTLIENIENLSLTGTVAIDGTGNTLVNTITGNSLANILDGQGGRDKLVGGIGNDTYIVDNTGVTVTEVASQGTDLVKAGVSYTLSANVENLSLTGVAAINGTGNTLVNTITGNSLANVLDGKGGADTLVGDDGDDTYIIGNTGVTVTEAADKGTDLVKASISYTLSGDVENLSLTGVAAINGTGNSLANTITGNTAANVLDGGVGADTLIGGKGNDTYIVDNASDLVTEATGTGTGTDLVKSSVTYTLIENIENLSLTGTVAIDGTGNTLVNTITGNSLANVLDGQGGRDKLVGGIGDDTYIIDNTGVTVTEAAAEGTDLVKAGVSYTLSANVENLSLTGVVAINGTGNTEVNTITGNSLVNVLDGGGGADTLVGDDGNDTYIIGNTGVTVTEAADKGTDLVKASISYTLLTNFEDLSLTGASAIDGTGNSLANTITGNTAANVLDGGVGADTLIGGKGNDIYIVDNASDLVTEDAGTGTGTDLVKSSVTYTLIENIENLSLTGTVAIDGTGNTLVNTITGNSLANVLDGGGGADILVGDDGDDTYIIGNTGITVTEAATQGTDLVKAGVSYTLSANVENLSLTGEAAINGTGNTDVNTITGNSLVNVLDGGGGADTLIGGDGNDTYIIGNTGVTVTEAADKGTDLVKASISYTLLANFEDLSLTGVSAIDGTGNSLANTITGNTAANTLDGGGGADTLIGGKGNDIYTIGNTGVTITEDAGTGTGTDLVNSSISYTLTENIENLSLTGTAADGTGNTLVNTITGNSVANILDGQGGADTLVGGDNNDTYIIDNTGVTVTEVASQGTDLVKASISYTLLANVENLLLTGASAINGTGNTDVNTITGNSLANVLDGGGGADTLIGDDGDDTYIIGNTGVTVTEASGKGTDLVKASISYTLLANFEDLSLTGSAIIGHGNTGVNTITGNTAANILYGVGGADTLIGGKGNDTYFIDCTGVTVTEDTGTGTGTDYVNTSISYTLTANVEDLTLVDSAAIGKGNTLVNTITGSDVANILDGGGGADTLIGGIGNDTYLIDNTGITVTESSGQGTDLVQASISYTLSADVENLSLTGSATIGVGNTLANTITGNDSGCTLNGGAGADTLIGGAGNDTYVLASGSGADTINADTGGTADLVNITAAGKTSADIAILNSGSDLIVSYSGDNADQATIKTYANIEKIQIASGSFLNQTDINEVVAAIAQYKVDHSGVTLDTVAQVRSETALMAIITPLWS